MVSIKGQKGKLVPAICSQCGGQLDVDPSKDAAVCPYCGTPFIVEKAINNYNIMQIYQKNTVNIQNGKKGFFQSAAELVDHQLEREHNAKIRAAELNIEQQKLDMIKEEQKKAAKSSFWKNVAYFFGWIYCFPIPLSIIISKKDDYDEAKKQKIKMIAWVVYIVLILFIGITESSTKKSTSSTNTTANTSVTITDESIDTLLDNNNEYEKAKQSNSFDVIAHNTVTIGDYVVEVPKTWKAVPPYYYTEDDLSKGRFAMVQIDMLKDPIDNVTEEAFIQGRRGFINGFFNGDNFFDSTILEERTIKLNGIVMNNTLVRTTIKGNSVALSGIFRLLWFLNPSDDRLIYIAMFESDDCLMGYKNDFWKISNSIKLSSSNSEVQNSIKEGEELGASETEQLNIENQKEEVSTEEINVSEETGSENIKNVDEENKKTIDKEDTTLNQQYEDSSLESEMKEESKISYDDVFYDRAFQDKDGSLEYYLFFDYDKQVGIELAIVYTKKTRKTDTSYRTFTFNGNFDEGLFISYDNSDKEPKQWRHNGKSSISPYTEQFGYDGFNVYSKVKMDSILPELCKLKLDWIEGCKY